MWRHCCYKDDFISATAEHWWKRFSAARVLFLGLSLVTAHLSIQFNLFWAHSSLLMLITQISMGDAGGFSFKNLAHKHKTSSHLNDHTIIFYKCTNNLCQGNRGGCSPTNGDQALDHEGVWAKQVWVWAKEGWVWAQGLWAWAKERWVWGRMEEWAWAWGRP